MAKTEVQFNDQSLSGTVPVNEQNLLQEFLQTVVLDDLNDVNISSPSSGQILVYQSGTQTWQNGNAAIVDGDKGDITTTSSGNTWTIDNNAITTNKIADNNVTTAKIFNNNVTNAKLAQVATATVKGRATAGTGDVEDLVIDADLSSVSANDDTIPSAKATKAYVDILELKTRLRNGGLLNGFILPTVATNNITLSISTSASSQVNPTASNPVYVWIDGVLRSITSALTVTANAGTNWFSSGSSETATLEIDYFAYIGYNATDGVTLGFSRIPGARIYSDFSVTSTNDKFCRISTITTAAAGDSYINVGRFAATLSATAAFNWSVPTYTNANLIQRPTFKTRLLTWAPTYSGNASMTFTSVSTTNARYYIDNTNLYHNVNASGTVGGTPSSQLRYTLPISIITSSSQSYSLAGWGFDGNFVSTIIHNENATLIRVIKYDASNWGAGASKNIYATGIIPLT